MNLKKRHNHGFNCDNNNFSGDDDSDDNNDDNNMSFILNKLKTHRDTHAVQFVILHT